MSGGSSPPIASIARLMRSISSDVFRVCCVLCLSCVEAICLPMAARASAISFQMFPECPFVFRSVIRPPVCFFALATVSRARTPRLMSWFLTFLPFLGLFFGVCGRPMAAKSAMLESAWIS